MGSIEISEVAIMVFQLMYWLPRSMARLNCTVYISDFERMIRGH